MSRISNTVNERQTPADTAMRQEPAGVASFARQQGKASQLKVVIVHDWLYGGGAEKVVLELHKMFPEAPIYTSYCTDEWRQKLDNKIITGYLQYWPFSALRKFLPVLRLRWFRRLNLEGYDLVISSSGNGEAKFVRTPKGAKHICYCHTPPHFYWRKYEEYLARPGFRPYWLVRLGLKLLVKPLRQRDYEAAQKVDYFIANSTHIQKDIKQFYGRDSVVIHPPVETERFQVESRKSKVERKGFVTAGRLVPYKHNDIIVEACANLGLPLKVIGSGPDLDRLKQLAGPTVEFLGFVPNEDMPVHFASAEAFIFAAEEDFGITPVEAMAAGTPVIAYKAGGALDYVIENETGLFFEAQTVESLASALKRFPSKNFNHQTIAGHAKQFSADVFKNKTLNFLDSIKSKRKHQ